jgi:dolichyl-phosphate-mannose-protein mannosyltransferase
MPIAKKVASRSAIWFWVSVLTLWLLSLGLRFWGLGRFNTLVFDEVYYVKFAHNYLTQTPFFDGHPPLSKYLIAFGMWVGNQLPIGLDAVNNKAGADYTTWSYRWLNALTGSLIPLVIMGIGYQLSRRYRYAFLAGLFAGLDGLLLVESRYALNNVYLLLFGLLGLWFLLIALNRGSPLKRSVWLVLAGICFGASASIKWNGLWFLLGAIGLWWVAWMLYWVQQRRQPADNTEAGDARLERTETALWQSPLQQLTRLHGWQVALYLGVVPAVFYRLIWIPHLKMNPKDTFWGLQHQILTYHQHVGSGPKVHPYCSTWYSWLAMQRPVAYFYQVTRMGDPLPTGDSQLVPTAKSIIYDVHAIGNPFLWWLSTIVIVLAAITLMRYGIRWLLQTPTTVPPSHLDEPQAFNPSAVDRWLLLFLLVNYAANLLPWVPVSRCAFLYHYMGASIFAMMALAWLVEQWLSSQEPLLKMAGIGLISLITLGFIFWMPVYLGLPLSQFAFQMRMWLPSWL